jgi:signal transduction histidine kinase
LTNLVEDLLNISRIESGRLTFTFTIDDLEPIVASVIEELESTAKAKNIYLKYEKPVTNLPLVKIDKNKIRQVIINIIDNSIKYTQSGGVTVQLIELGDFIRFSTIDTGMGIKPSLLQQLFQKFSRGEETSVIHTEGTGLGLYVGKMMIEEHGGRIWAESAGEGEGSIFSFELPIVSKQLESSTTKTVLTLVNKQTKGLISDKTAEPPIVSK